LKTPTIFGELPEIAYTEGTRKLGPGWYYSFNGRPWEGPYTSHAVADKACKESMTPEDRAAIEEVLEMDREIERDLRRDLQQGARA
jgi:hypothetical protein